MKTFLKTAAQGEICLERIEELPGGLVSRKPINGLQIIGHSESGHNHIMRAGGIDVLDRPDFSNSEGFARFYLSVSEPTPLEHQREHDTHEAIMVPPGNYEITITREYDPYADLARQTMD